MANKKNSADWFRHDFDASSDEKLLYLESVFGNDGYAMYFKLLEHLTRSDFFEIKLTTMTRGILSKKMNVTLDVFNQFIEESTREDVGAFVIEKDGTFYSNGLKKRLQPLIDFRERDRERKNTKNNKNGDFHTEKADFHTEKADFHTENDTEYSTVEQSRVENSIEQYKTVKTMLKGNTTIHNENGIAELPSENVLFSLSRTLLKYNNSQYKKSQKESYSQKLAKELVTEFGENAINRKLEHLEWKLRYDPPNDPGGYLVRSIREGWPPPAGYEEWIDEQRRINARSRSASGEALSVAELIKLSLNN